MPDTHLSAIKFLLFLGGLVIFLIFELITPYRPSTISKLRRWIINLFMAGFNSIVINILFAASQITTQPPAFISENLLFLLSLSCPLSFFSDLIL
ncbi:Uncharacterized protein dnm_071900 [Desulfonema magnum]|uniref:Uncharacterized protein n=1 Tax=Desulfonema magnum TaxID=45655 RepID=A0A975GRP1_9BACT|nr:Uncharacterized protein dnm_071900 [Desulfonema magnum]